jgi:hypothetical protein
MSSSNDIIIGRQGDSLTGTVNDPAFVIRTKFGDLTIPKHDIAQIHYQNPVQYPEDEIWTFIGDKHTGKIQAKEVDFTLYSGQKMKIPHRLIHTIFMMGTPDKNAPKLSSCIK